MFCNERKLEKRPQENTILSISLLWHKNGVKFSFKCVRLVINLISSQFKIIFYIACFCISRFFLIIEQTFVIKIKFIRQKCRCFSNYECSFLNSLAYHMAYSICNHLKTPKTIKTLSDCHNILLIANWN